MKASTNEQNTTMIQTWRTDWRKWLQHTYQRPSHWNHSSRCCRSLTSCCCWRSVAVLAPRKHWHWLTAHRTPCALYSDTSAFQHHLHACSISQCLPLKHGTALALICMPHLSENNPQEDPSTHGWRPLSLIQDHWISVLHMHVCQ